MLKHTIFWCILYKSISKPVEETANSIQLPFQTFAVRKPAVAETYDCLVYSMQKHFETCRRDCKLHTTAVSEFCSPKTGIYTDTTLQVVQAYRFLGVFYTKAFRGATSLCETCRRDYKLHTTAVSISKFSNTKTSNAGEPLTSCLRITYTDL